MALDVAVDALHVLQVIVLVVGLVLAEDLDDLPARLVPLGLAPIVALADRLGLLGLEPLFELLGRHVDGLVELVDDLLPGVRHDLAS